MVEMENGQRNESEKQAEEIMSIVLRWGIIFTSLVVLFGAVIFLVKHGTEVPNYKHFDGEQVKYTTLSGILKEAFSLNSLGIIQLGLLMLIFVPIVRVAVSIYTFAMQKDPTYVIVSLIVLSVLVYSFVSNI